MPEIHGAMVWDASKRQNHHFLREFRTELGQEEKQLKMEDNNVGEVARAASGEPCQELPTKLQVGTEEPAMDGDSCDDHAEAREPFTHLKLNYVILDGEALLPGHEEVDGADDEDSAESVEDDAVENSDEINCVELGDQEETTETCLHEDCVNESADNEVERHQVATILPLTELPVGVMAEASKTALFRRYSRMTPLAMEEQERSFHEDVFAEHATTGNSTFCPESTVQPCQNPACARQLRWRDSRIAELQAALDHMTEAMAIQQRDMASQRVFLSRQAEQLTNLWNKLHQDKVALHVERERFQQSVASTPQLFAMASKLKPATEEIKSPVKKLFSAATGRRATLPGVEPATIKLYSSSASPLCSASRTISSSQLRRNPLVSDSSTVPNPIKDRSSSLSVLDFSSPPAKQSVIAVAPTKNDFARMVDIKLTDGFSPAKPTTSPAMPSTPVTPTLAELDVSKRTDRVDSAADLSSEQKKQSLGDRLRSMRWTRS